MTANHKPRRGPKPNPARRRLENVSFKANAEDIATLDLIVADQPTVVSRSSVIRTALKRWADEITAREES